MKIFRNCTDPFIICIISLHVLRLASPHFHGPCLPVLSGRHSFPLLYITVSSASCRTTCIVFILVACTVCHLESMLKFLKYLIFNWNCLVGWGCFCFQLQANHHLILKMWKSSPVLKCNLQQLVTDVICVVHALKDR